jgi:hypothetical protein
MEFVSLEQDSELLSELSDNRLDVSRGNGTISSMFSSTVGYNTNQKCNIFLHLTSTMILFSCRIKILYNDSTVELDIHDLMSYLTVETPGINDSMMSSMVPPEPR